MEYQAVKKEIQQGKLAPVYFFFGEEVYLIEDLVRCIIEKGIDPSTKDFNFDVLQAEETDGSTVVSVASSFPMMAERRIVIVKSVQRLSTSDKKRVLEYAKAPSESTVLVLTAGKVDRRQSFYAGLSKIAHWVECKVLYENQAVDWLKHHLKNSGISISHEGATMMVQQTGASLWNLQNESDKLLTYAWGEKQLDISHVAAVVGFSRQFNAWEFSDAVGRKDLQTALKLMEKLLEAGQSPTGLIITLCRRILLLLQMRLMLDRGMSQNAVDQALGLRPFFSRMYVEQVRKYTQGELESGLKLLLMADVRFKTGYWEPVLGLSVVLHSLIRRGIRN